MFFSISWNIRNSFLSFPHLIIHRFTNDLESTDYSFSFCFIVSNDKIVEAMLFFENQHRVSTMYHLIHQGLRGSIMMNFLVRETTLGFSCRSQKVTLGLPIVRTFVSAFHMWRPNTVFGPLWVGCWRETFHQLLVVIVDECGLSVASDIGSPQLSSPG